MKHVTKEQIHYIVEYTLHGWSVGDIEKELAIPQRTIFRVLTGENKRYIEELKAEGYSFPIKNSISLRRSLMQELAKRIQEKRCIVSKYGTRAILVTELATNKSFAIGNIRRFAKDYGLYDSAIHKVLQGKIKQHKGYTFKYLV